jgi:tripartite-type tricarboxylate transporter receptor subunit TctC
MKVNRRHLLRMGATAAVLPAFSRIASGQAYPSRPVHIVVGFPAGSPADIIARLTAESLSERLGQQVVVDNRPGAAGNIAAEAVAKAPADGYTLLLITTAYTTNPSLFRNLSFNFLKDIEAVAGVNSAPFVMVVNPTFPAKTVPEFIAYAKANPGKINMATSGIGGPPHIFGALFEMMTSVKLVPVPYTGNYLPDLLSGQVQVAFTPIQSPIGFIRAGKLRALAVTSKTRSDAIPDVPALGEFVHGYEATGWIGIGAPKNTPDQITETLNRKITAGLDDPSVKARLAHLGAVPMPMAPSVFAKFLTKETDKWAKVIEFAGVKPM